MRHLVALSLSLLALAAHPAAAQGIVYEVVEESVVTVDEPVAERLLAGRPDSHIAAVASYGPFRVLDDRRAGLVDVTDAGSPGQFAAMLRDHPGIATLEMIDCPGTEDDRANLRLGRMIRASGMATHVPDGGFVGSGAVELFLAGAHRRAEPSAEFAVHSWADEDGREASDYAADAPENRAYLDYYRAMGMTAEQAAAFYAMTNSVPFAQAKYLSAGDMSQWAALETPMPDSPMLDSAPRLP